MSLVSLSKSTNISFDMRNDSNRLLMLMLSIQLVFLMLFLVNAFAFPTSAPFARGFLDINVDRSLSESFQYIQELWIIALTALLVLRSRNYFFLFWPITFSIFLVDDSFKLHELRSTVVARFFGLERLNQTHLWLVGTGQAITLILTAAVFLVLLVALYRFGNKEFKKVSKTLVVFLAIIAFFAVGVDTVHDFSSSYALRQVLSVVEEGGEMMTISFVVWYLFGLLSPMSGAKGS